jgi:PAS domain S-box-containing protein
MLDSKLVQKNQNLNYVFFMNIIESLDENIFIKDEQFRFLLLNTPCSNYINKSKEEIIGTDDYSLFSYELAKVYQQAEIEMIKANEPIRLREYCVDSFGKMRYVYSVKMPFYLPDTQKMGILGYQFEITELKNIEPKILEAENCLFELEEMLSLALIERKGLIEYIREIASQNQFA